MENVFLKVDLLISSDENSVSEVSASLNPKIHLKINYCLLKTFFQVIDMKRQKIQSLLHRIFG